MAAVIAKLSRLQELSIGLLDPNPVTLASLKSLKSLRKLVCQVDDAGDREAIAGALPDVNLSFR
jgi:hypothetical protein